MVKRAGRRDSRGPSQRQLRVAEAVRHVLVGALQRGTVRDPGVQGVSVTVSEVRVSPDLRSAIAYVSPFGGGDTAAMLAGLERAAPFLRGIVARSLDLKFAPRLSFEADASFDRAAHIDALLRGQVGAAPGDEDDEPA